MDLKAVDQLNDAGAQSVITTNTVLHETNAIDISGLIGNAACKILNEACEKPLRRLV